MSGEGEPRTVGESRVSEGGRRTGARRAWSGRRLPAALVAGVGAAACAWLLFYVVVDRTGLPAPGWHTEARDRLSEVRYADGWVIGSAGALAVVGLWLVVLALTPGARHRLPMAPPRGAVAVRADLDRALLAVLLREAALAVPGISRATVKVRRRRVTITAEVRFGDLTIAQATLHEALETKSARLGLARPPQLRARVSTNPDYWAPPPAGVREKSGNGDDDPPAFGAAAGGSLVERSDDQGR